MVPLSFGYEEFFLNLSSMQGLHYPLTMFQLLEHLTIFVKQNGNFLELTQTQNPAQ